MKIKILQIDEDGRKQHIQEQIDDIELQLFQVSEEVNGLDELRNQYRKYTVSIGAYVFLSQMKILVFLMFAPFVFSIILESISAYSKKHENTEKATKTGIVSMIFGFIMLIIGLNLLFSNNLY